ncbi:MAG: SDR family oxidoreductase [Candidatus Woesearchaeota archaeon]
MHIVITGTSSGIGLALVELLCQQHTVTGIDCVPSSFTHPAYQHLTLDITQLHTLDIAPVDMLIINAGIMRRGDIMSTSLQDMDDLYQVNIKGTMITLQMVLPLMKKGTVVFNASRHARHITFNPVFYGLTKHAMMYIAKALEKEYPQLDVRMLYPGPTDTPVAHQGLSKKAIDKKKHIMHTPQFVAEHIVAFLQTSHKSLVYHTATRTYESI